MFLLLIRLLVRGRTPSLKLQRFSSLCGPLEQHLTKSSRLSTKNSSKTLADKRNNGSGDPDTPSTRPYPCQWFIQWDIPTFSNNGRVLEASTYSALIPNNSINSNCIITARDFRSASNFKISTPMTFSSFEKDHI